MKEPNTSANTSNTSKETKEFILEFFKDSVITEKNNVFNIAQVPKDFEEFLGKKAPYKLVFDFDTHNKTDDSELIMKGSYFLLAIRDYLRTKGQTSLLKMDLKFQKPSLNKNIKFGNCKLIEVKEKPSFHYFPEFTFISICQYLNEKKQFINKLQIKDNATLNIDTSKLKAGSPQDLHNINITKEYQAAKLKLRDLINKESKELKKILHEKLEKELIRVKDYYEDQIKEKDDEVERCAEKIKLLKSELKHTYYDRDASILKRKIREYEVMLEKLKQHGYKERLKHEEDFHINDEKDKHILTINNHLLNTTIVYYPSLTFSLLLQKDKKSAIATLNLGYDSLSKKFDNLACASCKQPLKTINLCADNHLVCQKCLKNCVCCKESKSIAN